MGRAIQVLTFTQIVEINHRLLEEFGGFFAGAKNLQNPISLEHLLEEIEGFIFDQELYPDIFSKAALIAQRIIIGHICYDGNKRTGMESCRMFLEINGYNMVLDHEAINVALDITAHKIQFNEIRTWLINKSTKMN